MPSWHELNRRDVLKKSALTGLALAGVGSVDAKQISRDDVIISEANTHEIDLVRQSRPFKDTTTDLPDQGDRLDFERAETVRKQKGDDQYKLAVPLKDMESFDPMTTVKGLHAHVNPKNENVKVIVRYEYNKVDPSELDSSTEKNEVSAATTETTQNGGSALATDTVTTLSNECHYAGITPGYYCNGAYDTEEACTVIGAAAVLIPSDDITGIGVIDDVALPVVEPAAAGCAIEQAVELGITDWLNACSTNNWVWEIYTARWWNPVPQQFLALPRCG